MLETDLHVIHEISVDHLQPSHNADSHWLGSYVYRAHLSTETIFFHSNLSTGEMVKMI